MGCAVLDHIDDDCPTNEAGLVGNAWVIDQDHVTTIPSATEGVITTNLTLAADMGFYRMSFLEESAELKLVGQGDIGSKMVANTVTFKIPKVTPAKSEILTRYMNSRLIAIVKDAHGAKHLLGDKDRPARLMFEASTGTKPEDFNGYTVTITWKRGRAPYGYTGTITEFEE